MLKVASLHIIRQQQIVALDYKCTILDPSTYAVPLGYFLNVAQKRDFVDLHLHVGVRMLTSRP